MQCLPSSSHELEQTRKLVSSLLIKAFICLLVCLLRNDCLAVHVQVKVLEGPVASTTMRSQAGGGPGSLAPTQQRASTTPGSPNQQSTKGFHKMAKGTTRPMGATLPVSPCHPSLPVETRPLWACGRLPSHEASFPAA